MFTRLSLEMLHAKTCPRCGELKPPDAFYTGRSYCKACCRAYYQENRERHLAQAKQWAKDNPQRLKELRKAEHERNRGKRNAWRRARDKANPGKRCAKETRRKAAKMDRLPAWADLKAIRAVYESCPPGHHVDHVIPLRGKDVSGLHVAGNLQYLTAEENVAKGNAF
jgi:hypothetical protein